MIICGLIFFHLFSSFRPRTNLFLQKQEQKQRGWEIHSHLICSRFRRWQSKHDCLPTNWEKGNLCRFCQFCLGNDSCAVKRKVKSDKLEFYCLLSLCSWIFFIIRSSDLELLLKLDHDKFCWKPLEIKNRTINFLHLSSLVKTNLTQNRPLSQVNRPAEGGFDPKNWKMTVDPNIGRTYQNTIWPQFFCAFPPIPKPFKWAI